MPFAGRKKGKEKCCFGTEIFGFCLTKKCGFGTGVGLEHVWTWTERGSIGTEVWI